jgi:hypothetical protein
MGDVGRGGGNFTSPIPGPAPNTMAVRVMVKLRLSGCRKVVEVISSGLNCCYVEVLGCGLNLPWT